MWAVIQSTFDNESNKSLEKNEIYLLTNNLRAYRKIVPVMAFLIQITACILLDFASG